MAPRLTDIQKKKILADYAERQNYSEVARINGVSDKTVKRIVCECPEISRKVEQKKEENTLAMLEYMDKRKTQAQAILDIYLEAMSDPDRISQAPLSQLATSFGIVVDKFMPKGTSGFAVNREDDPITTALKEAAQDGLF